MSKAFAVLAVVLAAAGVGYLLRSGGSLEPPVECKGVRVAAGADIQAAIDDHDEGTTFCLSAGTYEIEDNIEPKDGSRLIGEGMERTFLKSTDANIIIDAEGASNIVIAHMDVSGAPGSLACKPRCGSGFSGGTDSEVSFVRLHDNANHGIGGSDGGLVVEDSILDHNGSDAFTGCCAGGIKSGIGFIIRNSQVFANIGNGVWCDSGCRGGLEAHDNEIYDNARDGIRYEVSSGGAIIEGNTVRDNDTADDPGVHGGITNIASKNAEISGNVLGGNNGGGILITDTPRGDSRNVVVSGNELGGDRLVGCGDGVSCEDNTS